MSPRAPVSCGDRYGRWVILSEDAPRAFRSGQSQRMVLARCDCGRLQKVQLSNLRSGRSTQCKGCWLLKAQPIGTAAITTHGKSWKNGRHTPEYNTWKQMIRRCSDKATGNNRKRYFERGIQVCERWIGCDGIIHFIEDMGIKPKPELTLDRINNDGSYEPLNCRWATRKQQAENRGCNAR